METWMAEWTKHLEHYMRADPASYGLKEYDHDKMKERARKMRFAFERGKFLKDSKSIKATCKALGIKHTYKDIARFIANHK